MLRRTLYFNTGVRPDSGVLFGRQVWERGTKHIQFTCYNVPDHARFLFACNDENSSELKMPGVIVRRIVDSGPDGLLSQFAYFKI